MKVLKTMKTMKTMKANNKKKLKKVNMKKFNNKYLKLLLTYLSIQRKSRQEILETADDYFDKDMIYQIIIELKLLNKIILDADRLLQDEDLDKIFNPKQETSINQTG